MTFKKHFLSDLRLTEGQVTPVPNGSPFTLGRSANLWLATLAGLTLAVSPWHLALSRLDQRPLAVPMLAVLVFWFFLKGWAGGRLRWFILSGLSLGLAFHTYSAARLLPVILFLAFLPEFFLARPQSLSRLRYYLSRISLFLLSACLVAAPLLWYFLTHPAQFSARAASVMVWAYLSTPAEILAELGRNLLRVLGFFCCTGSPNAIFGLPGQPGLPLWLTPFLVIGLVVALKNWRNLPARLVALWWGIGITPSIVAIEAPHPLRMIVALPPTAILVALGLVQAAAWLSARLGPYASRLTFYALPLLLILSTIPATFSAYFVRWTELPVTQGIYDYGAIAIRDAVLAHADDARPIYLPLARYNDQPLLYYLGGVFQREARLSVPPANQALVIAPEKNEGDTVWVRLQGHTATILPPLTVEGQQLIRAALADPSARPIQTPRGEVVAHLAALPTDPARFLQPPTRPLTATLGPARLTGAAYPLALDPASGQLPVTLYWQAGEQMADEYEVLLQLVDDHRRVWGDGTARPNDWAYPTTFWRPGLDHIAARQVITFEPNTLPPGRYWLAVSLYDSFAGRRWPLREGISESPDTFFIGPVKVPLPAPILTGVREAEQALTFGQVIRLAGYQLENPTLKPGQSLRLKLLWQALKNPPVDYTVFVHLLDAQDNLVMGNDAQPVGGSYPTTLWSPGERILDARSLPLPASLPPGQYRLAVGLYYQPTGERLPLQTPAGGADPQGRLILTPVVRIE